MLPIQKSENLLFGAIVVLSFPEMEILDIGHDVMGKSLFPISLPF